MGIVKASSYQWASNATHAEATVSVLPNCFGVRPILYEAAPNNGLKPIVDSTATQRLNAIAVP